MTAYAAWAAAAGQTFEATAGDGERFPLRLASVSPARRSNGWLGYTLEFTAAPDSAAQQQIHALRGAGIDEAVFLVPTGRTGDGLTLEAAFMVADPADDAAATSAATTATAEEER